MKKRINIIYALIILLSIATGTDAAGTAEDGAVRLVSGLADNLTESPLNVTIGELTIENSNFSSEFADKFLETVMMEFKRYPSDFIKVKRTSNTRGGLHTLNRIQPDEPEKIADVTLTGNYRVSADKKTIFVSARLAKDNSKRISSYEIEIDNSTINWDIEPPNLTKIRETEKEIASVPQTKNDFNIDAWIDKGNGSVYRGGEKISLMVRSEVDCYIKVLYIDASGNRILMYPTERDTLKKLKKGNIYNLDKNNDYEIAKPYGSEMIILFASTQPIGGIGEIDMGGGYRGFGPKRNTSEIVKKMRGLEVKMRSVLRSEAKIFLTTVGE